MEEVEAAAGLRWLATDREEGEAGHGQGGD